MMYVTSASENPDAMSVESGFEETDRERNPTRTSTAALPRDRRRADLR
jgi:hypothetical protein